MAMRSRAILLVLAAVLLVVAAYAIYSLRMQPRPQAKAAPAAPAGQPRPAGQPAVPTNPPNAPAAGNASAATQRPGATMTGPARGWAFPVFSDKEGYRLLRLTGSEARILDANRIEVAAFSAVVFSGDASERVDTILLSPQATFFPKENRAAGSSDVRLILSGSAERKQDDVEVTGRGWTYDHASKKVSIAHDVRVTFHAQLNDILK